MTIHFIGAGPGDPELLTLKAQRLLRESQLCIYTGSFISKEFIDLYVDEKIPLIDSALLDLDEIIFYMKEAHEKGQDVARLHSGDPSLYSAVHEQIFRLKALHIPYDVTAGVPAFCAAAAAMGQELTIPYLNQSLIITRFSQYEGTVPSLEDLEILGQSRSNLALHLSIQHVEKIYQKLAPLYGDDCPVIIAYRISHMDEQIFRIELKDLIKTVNMHQLQKTAIIFIGQALSLNINPERTKLYNKKCR